MNETNKTRCQLPWCDSVPGVNDIIYIANDQLFCVDMTDLQVTLLLIT